MCLLDFSYEMVTFYFLTRDQFIIFVVIISIFCFVSLETKTVLQSLFFFFFFFFFFFYFFCAKIVPGHIIYCFKSQK